MKERKCHFVSTALLGLLMLVLMTGAGTAADDFPPLCNSHPVYKQVRENAPGGETIAVNGLVLKKANATFTFQRGTFHLLSPVENRVTGAVFTGEGELRVEPVRDSEKWSLNQLTDGAPFVETFKELVIRFSDDTLEQLKKGGAVTTGTPVTQARDFLSDFRKLFRKGRLYNRPNIAAGLLKTNQDIRIFMELTATRPSGMFMAFLKGDKYGEFYFLSDPLGVPYAGPEEVALVGLSEGNLGAWVCEHYADHYRKDASAENNYAIDSRHFQISATCRKDRMEATAVVRFAARADGLRVIPFNLFGKLRVSKVLDEQKRELSFIQEDKDEDSDFAVIMPEPVRQGQEYTLTFTYAGDQALLDVGGGNYTLAARDSWYPNTYFGDTATYEMTLQVPKGLIMVATGQLVKEIQEGDLTVTEWKSDQPLTVAGFNYGDFKKAVSKEEKTGYVVETYANKYLPNELKEYALAVEDSGSAALGNLNTVKLMDKARSEALVAIGLFSDLFGPLHYGRLAMTQQPFPNFGQAWPMLVYLPITSFFDSTQLQTMTGSTGGGFFKEVAAHEVSHQWWGHALGWKSYRDQWLSEGGAVFSASMFVQSVYKPEEFLEYWKKNREQIFQKNRQGKKVSDYGLLVQGYRLDNAKTGDLAQTTIYPKAGFVFHMLRMMMWEPKTGDTRFLTMIKDLLRTRYNQAISTEDFQRAVEKHITPEMDLDGNGKMDWFFKQWVYGTEIPTYKLDYQLQPEGGKCRLICKVTQSGVSNEFAMRVPIYFEIDGSMKRLGGVNLFGNGSSPEINVLLPVKPKKVMLCAYEDVLCKIEGR